MILIRRIAAGLHLIGAALVLLFVAATFANAARNDFEPGPSAYARPEVEAGRVVDQLRRIFRDGFAKARLTVWGLAEEPGSPACDADSPGIFLANRLHELGASVQVHDPQARSQAQPLLAEGIPFQDNALEAARGADAILLMTEWPEYLDIDLQQLAGFMRGKVLFDGRLSLDASAAEAAGLNYVIVGSPSWPAWLDPELHAFVADAAEQVPERAGPQALRANGILVFPRNFMSNHPRSRWYLPLNYHLFPRRLYLIRPTLANGTVGQFQQWIDRSMQAGGLSPARLLDARDKKRAIWFLRYDAWVDFRKRDFRLERLPAQ